MRPLATLFALGTGGERTDGQLLDRFASGSGEAAERAFAALVERHGPMVRRICRAVLRDGHDADDAFQATWLVLVRRRVDVLGGRIELGPWLGGVAYRTAQAARTASARRRRLEGRAARRGQGSAPAAEPEPASEVGAIVREEVDRLPERFRPAVALCLLDGVTIAEAAQTLGCPVGTLQSRLARGRSHLRSQLARRGIEADSALAAPLLASGVVPATLAHLTTRAATRVAAGATLLAGTGSAPLASLVRRVLVMMVLAKLRIGLIVATALVGSLGLAGAVGARGAGGRANPPPDQIPQAKPPEPSPYVPLPPVPPAETLVPIGQSVQAAIDAAPEGATIRLAAGEYPEALTIAKPLTLLGAGWDKTVVGPTTASKLSAQQKAEFFDRYEATSNDFQRRTLVEELNNQIARPTLLVDRTIGVEVAGIRWRGPTPTANVDNLGAVALVNFRRAAAVLRDCAVVGPFANGIRADETTDLVIERSLIAGVWGSGLVVRDGHVRVSDSDIRNCCYAGIVLKGEDPMTVERCRVSGAAWHGIRYDDCSPTIERCQIFGNARSGIYASGKTAAKVSGNVFWRNEMDGMSAWFANADTVSQNTFVANQREGFLALGGAKPTLHRNVFVDQPVAIGLGKVNGDPSNGRASGPMGAPVVTDNVFFRNGQILKDGVDDRPLPEGNTTDDPQLSDAATGFHPFWKDGSGALKPTPLASPFPLQPGEILIIPDGATRDYRAWKKPTGTP